MTRTDLNTKEKQEEVEALKIELIALKKKLVFQNKEKTKRAAELVIANKERVFQNKEKKKRAVELVIANKELVFQNEEKKKRADELVITKKERVFQNGEKTKRAVELVIANKELVFQNEEKKKRAVELVIANKELVFQNEEKKKRAVELVIAKKTQEGYLQVFEKGFVTDYPLTIKNKNGNLADVLYNASVYKDDKGNVLGVFASARDVTEQKQSSQYARSLIEASLDPLVTISAEGKITDVNEASVKVTGIPREKLIETAILFPKLLIMKSFKLSILRLFLMFVIVSFSISIVRAQGALLLNRSDGTYLPTVYSSINITGFT
jgi:PAS domain-containing protein